MEAAGSGWCGQMGATTGALAGRLDKALVGDRTVLRQEGSCFLSQDTTKQRRGCWSAGGVEIRGHGGGDTDHPNQIFADVAAAAT